MAYYLLSSPLNGTKKDHNGKNKKDYTGPRGSHGVGQSVPLWFVPPLSHAVQSRHDEGRQCKDIGNMQSGRIWQTCRIRLVQTIREGRSGRPTRERRTRTETADEPCRHTRSERSGAETSAEHQESEGRMGILHRQTCERINLQTFFRSLGARYKRIRKRPRVTPSPQLVGLKVFQLQELVKLWKAGHIGLWFGDESHVCTSGYVPYGWQFPEEDVCVPVQKEQRLNIFGMVSPACEYLGFDSTESINGERLADYLDGFSRKIDRPTFIVLDNASIHRKGEVAKKMKEWKERGLYLFFLPPYSPHLNIAETVWRMLKTQWLYPEHYRSKQILHETTREILSKIGSDYIIRFSHAA